MDINELSQQIEDFRRRLTDMQSHAQAEPDQRELLLESAFMDIATSLEELRVTEEEIRVQDEQLINSRVEVEGWRQYYQDLFHSAPDAYIVTDLYGVIREANRAAVRLLRLKSRLLIGSLLVTFIPDEDRRQFRDLLSEIVRARRIREHELRIKPRRGPVHSVALTVAVTENPLTNIDGQQSGASSLSLRWLVREVGHRQAAEADRYRRLVSEITDYAIILMEPDGRILSWNRGAEKILVSTEAEMLGKSADLIFTPQDCAKGIPGQERYKAATDGRTPDERWHLRLDGTRFWGSGVMISLRDSEGILRWYAKVMRDFTAQHETQEVLKQELRREHNIAETFQRALLPVVAPDAFAGLTVAYLYEAAWEEAQVGGDFYDIYALENGTVALVVGDVSGKGLGAAVRAGEIRAVLRAFLREHPNPATALTRLNAYVCDRQSLDGEDTHQYTTLALIVLDPETGTMTCALAGADPPLLLRITQPSELLGASSVMLGVVPKHIFSATAHQLEPGDRVLLVTDGVTEARRGSEFLDPEGIQELALAASAMAPQAMCQCVLDGARDFAGGSLSDDACLLVAERL